MSLTSMLKGKDPKSLELQRIVKAILPKKNQFYTLTGNAPFDVHAVPVSPYDSENLRYSGVIGTTIELMGKYHIGRLSKFKGTIYNARTTGLASSGLELLEYSLDKLDFDRIYFKFSDRYKYIKSYVEGKDVSINDLIKSAILSSKLENCARTGMLPENPILYFTEDIQESVVDDLKSLFRGFLATFVETKILHNIMEIDFHPIFGVASKSVGGADGDLYINGTMYDFKTSKKRGYEWQEIAQLICYSLLSDISSEIFDLDIPGLSNEFPYKTNRIAFYRTRFNEIEYFNLNEIPREKWDTAKTEIKKLLNIKY